MKINSNTVTNALSQIGVHVSTSKTPQRPDEMPTGTSFNISFRPREFKTAIQIALMKAVIANTKPSDEPIVSAPRQHPKESSSADKKGRLVLATMIRGNKLDKAAFASVLDQMSKEELERPDATGLNLATTAVLHHDFEAIRLLQQRGVDFKAPNEDGTNAKDFQKRDAKQFKDGMAQAFAATTPEDRSDKFKLNLSSMQDEAVIQGHEPLLDNETYAKDYHSETPAQRKADLTMALKRISDNGLPIGELKHAMFFTQASELHMRASHFYLAETKTMIALGADVNQKTDNGLTPLHFCFQEVAPTDEAKANRAKVVETLLEAGADPAIRDEISGAPVLNNLSRFGDAKTVGLALEHGADVNAQDRNGVAPIHAAIVGGNMETFKALLDAGAKLDVETLSGNTPLMVAQKLKKPEFASVIENLEATKPATAS
ncbi:MAG: ankyrin repeat domain-containing protein [Janthinobacterium lividum]